jgi:tetratricopeptide (TPR) repeat protein
LGAILGNVKHDHTGAEAEFRTAIRLNPDHAHAHCDLGRVLADQGKVSEAISAYREAIRLKPDYADAHLKLGNALIGQGKLDEAFAEYSEAIRLKPEDAMGHYNLGNTLTKQGKLPEAVAEFREAIRIKPDYAEAHCNLGLFLERQGQYAGALVELRRGHELGSKQPVWPYPSAQWVRDAERLAALATRLPAILKGIDGVNNNADRLAIAQWCYRTKRHAAAARFWAEALNDDPKLADDRRAEHRYNAACAAALAGSGQGSDDPMPNGAARARLRGQALDWLKAELAASARVLDSADANSRQLVIQTLEHWRVDSDLDGIRGADALAKLPDAERGAWRSLWADVDSLLARARTSQP